jgi:type IV secretion system protein VirB10
MAGRQPWSTKTKWLMGVMVAGSLGGLIWLSAAPSDDGAAARQQSGNGDRVGEIGTNWSPIVDRAPPPPLPGPTQLAAARAPELRGAPPPPQAAVATGGRPVSRTPISAFQASAAGAREVTGGGGAGEAGQAVTGAGGGDDLDQRLSRGADQDTAVATMLPDRDRFITMGTPMGCLPESPINTDTPGPFRCRVTHPVYSTSGAVPLLDAGTWLVGTISESVRRGSRRAFGVMRRIETPQGCIVRLRAPVADQMGEAGLDGEVDNHFFERFRGLAAMALLDAAGQAAAIGAAQALTGGGNQQSGGVSLYQFQGMGRQLGQGFADDTNIPPTLRRNQALPILVMAMQDIDMRNCFRLRRTEYGR